MESVTLAIILAAVVVVVIIHERTIDRLKTELRNAQILMETAFEEMDDETWVKVKRVAQMRIHGFSPWPGHDKKEDRKCRS